MKPLIWILVASTLLGACRTIPPKEIDTPEHSLIVVTRGCAALFGTEASTVVVSEVRASGLLDIPAGEAGLSLEYQTRVVEATNGIFSNKDFLAAVQATGDTITGVVNTFYNCLYKALDWGEPPSYKPTVTFYLDKDGDGYGVEDQTHRGTDRPEGFASFKGDCADNDANVFPGQGRWFQSVSASGSYDYDCDKEETQEIIVSGSCRDSCGAANEGWADRIPACGESAAWLNDCDLKVSLFKVECVRETQIRRQSCR